MNCDPNGPPKGSMKKLKKISTIVVITIFLIITFLYGMYKLLNSRTFQLFGTLVNRADTQEKVVALTLDDAPTIYTDEVLKILTDENVHATFYAIGNQIEQYPDQTKAIIAQGSELGNHSYSHQTFFLKSQSFIQEEIERTDQLIRNAGYTGEITFRPPYSKKLIGLPWYLWQHNIKTIEWDVEPDTYYKGDTEKIVSYTLEHAVPGSIILLHPFCVDACASDREALPQIIEGLKAKGFTFVTISQLLTY
jgi:peptidoglycan/xylan/chitin deacetylase (PgdA/CDA1 family)